MRRRPFLLAAAAGTVPLLAACATGPRPTLGPAATAMVTVPLSQDADVDGVLEPLTRATQTTFTANYRITGKLGGTTYEARVTAQPPRRAAKIGTTVFVDRPLGDLTCDSGTGACEPGRLEQKISQVQGLSSRFWGPAPAAALKVAYDRRSGTPTVSFRDIAGMSASCVAIPVRDGRDEYCSLPDGALAYLDTAGLRIELLSFDTTVDAGLLATGG